MLKKLLTAAAAVLLAAGLLAYPVEVGQAVGRALQNCSRVVIPSLFPFMALSGFIALADLGRLIALPLAPLFKKLYGLSPEMGGLVLSGFVGGYPVAASSMASLIDQKRMSPDTAARLLTLCTNAGPSFVISIAGAAVLGSARAGVALYGAQTLSALITGWLFLRRRPQQPDDIRSKGLPAAPALVKAVRDASLSMVYICGFYVVFSALIAVLQSSGLFGALTALISTAALGHISAQTAGAATQGMLEVVAGCLACRELPGPAAVALVPFLLSFSSLSVFCQVASCLYGKGVSLRPFAYSRLIHGALSTAIAIPLVQYFAPAATVFSPQRSPEFSSPPETIIGTLCIVIMCSMLFMSAEDFGRKNLKNRP